VIVNSELLSLAEQHEGLLRRIAEVRQRGQIGCHDDVAALLLPLFDPYQEQLRAVLLTTKNDVIDSPIICQGSGNTAMVRIADIFRPAIVQGAVSIIISHGHPSGDPRPSPEDIRLTSEAVAAGKLLGIELADHVVVGSGGEWYSMRQHGVPCGWSS